MEKKNKKVVSTKNSDTKTGKKVAAQRVAKKSKKVTSRSTKSTKKQQSRYVPFIAIGIFVTLAFISVFMLMRHSSQVTDSVILHDVEHLHKIFENINSDCKIIDFEHEKNYIDFLTVEKFVGSEVGAMNVSTPANWKGPYVKDNPTVQEQQYIILKNKNGYYLAPGDGVKLANGKIVGKDIILNEQSDMEALMKDEQALKSAQGSLAAKITVGGSFLKQVIQKPLRFL